MLAASTPIHPRKRKAGDGSPGISPIRRTRTAKLNCIPKLPKGTTLEVLRGSPLRKRPLADNQNMGNLLKSTVEAQTKNSLAYLNGIISLPFSTSHSTSIVRESCKKVQLEVKSTESLAFEITADKITRPPSALPIKRQSISSSIPVKQKRKTVHALPRPVSQGTSDILNPNLMGLDQPSKKNVSQFPELIVISESDEEPEDTVQHRTRKSVALRRKTVAAALTEDNQIPDKKDFVKSESRLRTGSRVSISSSTLSTKFLPVVPECHGYLKAGSTLVTAAHDDFTTREYTTIIKSEPQDDVMRHFVAHRGCAVVKSDKILLAPPNGLQGRTKQFDTYEFNSESQQQAEPEISKFTMTDVDLWKEMKDQQGVFFSKAPAPLSSGSDGDAFPARTGFLKMEAKKTLDIHSCANNVVFTVVKGKGRLKNKTEMKGANPKTDMIVGDILTVPQGSTFNFVNLGTKNDLIMSYVKLS